jgi:hypothetical protein
VARVELGASDYGVNAYLSGTDSIILGITQRPGTNALAAAEGVKAELADAAKSFPEGLEYRIIWNPTEFISESMGAVQETLVELARGDHSDRRHSGLADRNVRSASGARILAQHIVDVRPGAGDRHCRR